jgi:uncharacterized protein
VLLPILLAFLAAPARVPTSELQVPKNQGWVTDLAGLLSSDEERELETLMESYKRGTTHEIALLTIPSLEGADLARFALEVGRTWGIGGKDANNGALLLVSKEDRAVRIEVGRGLEGNLTDSISGRIIRDVIVPKFKQGQFAAGLKEGVVTIHEAIGGEYGRIPARRSGRNSGRALPPFIVILIVLAIILSRISRGGRRRRGGGLLGPIFWGGLGGHHMSGGGGGGFGGGFSGFGGGGGFSGGGASGRW